MFLQYNKHSKAIFRAPLYWSFRVWAHRSHPRYTPLYGFAHRNISFRACLTFVQLQNSIAQVKYLITVEEAARIDALGDVLTRDLNTGSISQL